MGRPAKRLPLHPRGPSPPARCPPDPAGLLSEGGEVDLIKLHIEGSLTIPKPGNKRV